MNVRRIAAAASFATGAALAFAPFASADASSDSASLIDSLISGVSPAAGVTDFQISFNGMDLFSTAGNEATATTVAGEYGLAIAYGNGANAIAEGGTGDYALASGTNALAHAGSLTATSGFDYDTAEDIGNNTAGGVGAPDGAYAGGGSLLAGDHDSVGTAVSSHDSAYLFGNTGPDTADAGGNSGAFAGDGQLIGISGAGSGDTAYLSGNILGQNDGPAAVDGNNNFASESGNENGVNEGAFAAIGNNNTAIADTNYTESAGVSAIGGNGNYAYVYGPDNSTADAGGTSTAIGEPATVVSSNNIAYVTDPFGTTGAADSAVAGSGSSGAGGSDIAEVLYTNGHAAAQGAPNLYDIITPFGTSAGPAAAAEAGAATAAAVPAAVTPITSTVTSEIASLNSQFEFDTLLSGVPTTDILPGSATDPFDTIVTTDITAVQGTGTTPFDYLIYGVDPAKAGLSTDPGSFEVFNGAESKFDDAYNVLLYAAENNGALDTNAADFIGNLPTGFASDTPGQALEYFYNFAVGDLSGFFGTDLSSTFDITAAQATALIDLFDPSAAASLF